MSDYVVTCCSSADLSLETIQKRNIPFAMFHYTINGTEYPDDLGQTIPFDKFYQMIKDGAMPTTSAVNVDQYVDMFDPILASGHDILHLALSSGISGTYNAAKVAQTQMQEKYPDRKIIVIDSLAASGGFGLLTILADDNRLSGMSIDENAQWVLGHRLNLHHWFFSTDLTSYWRGGRVSRFSAAVGGALNICPLLNVNSEGKLIPRERIRGKKKVIHAIAEKMFEHAQGGENYTGKVFITHSACYDDARAVADLIEAHCPHMDGKVVITSIGNLIGSHTGPGTVALFFMGDERTL